MIESSGLATYPMRICRRCTTRPICLCCLPAILARPLAWFRSKPWQPACLSYPLSLAQAPLMLIETGVTGRVVPARDPGALAGAINALLADANLRAQMV